MRGARARGIFEEGKNCPQAVALAFEDVLGIPKEKLEALSLPLGAGLGRLRGTCGALTGACLALGVLFEGRDKAEIYALVQELAARFQQECGSTVCAELLKKAGIEPSTSPTPAPRTAEFYASRPCPALVETAAHLVEQLCSEHGISI